MTDDISNFSHETIDEANRMIPELQLFFIRIQQMQLQIQRYFKELKNTGIDFIPKNDKELLLLHETLDDEAVDTVSSLKVLLANIQDEIKKLSNRGCNVASIDQGKVCWPCKHLDKDVLLSWHVGEKEINYWQDANDTSKLRRPLSELTTSDSEIATTA